jgi:hypothetical protein
MIMYAWKQFGNDFRNGDDAVFWDSNRPRDDNGTKIRPWLQGDKWKFREANKKTDFSMLQLQWMTLIENSTANQPVKREVPTFVKWKRTTEDLPDGLTEENLKAFSYKEWSKGFKNDFVFEPNYILTEWTVTYDSWGSGTTVAQKQKKTTYVEIVEDWLYYFLVSGNFYFWRNGDYDSVNSYKDKIWAYLFSQREDWVFWMNGWQSYRATWNNSAFAYSICTLARKWDRYLPAFAQASTNNYNCFCAATLRVIKMW